MASDEEYMRLALAAARKAGNATWRNPRVGSCLVKDGKVPATGFHQHYGGFHAERDTISKLTPEQIIQFHYLRDFRALLPLRQAAALHPADY